MSSIQVPRPGHVQVVSPAGLHRMAYVEWGDPANPKVLLCAHGLTRTGRDFDDLARNLAHEYRVVCPDVLGRGASDWLRDPGYYEVAQYVSDMVTLLAKLEGAAPVQTLHWVGTSMGGLIGMSLAALPGNPIAKLVLNDIGPELSGAALQRIADYVGQPISFGSFAEADAYIREISASFGPHSDAEWRTLTAKVMVEKNGRWGLHYDPTIALAYRKTATAYPPGQTLTLWPYYDAVQCPTLAIRGEESDLLSAQVHQQMALRGPKATLLTLAGIGHAPTFMHSDQIQSVRDFLLGT